MLPPVLLEGNVPSAGTGVYRAPPAAPDASRDRGLMYAGSREIAVRWTPLANSVKDLFRGGGDLPRAGEVPPETREAFASAAVPATL